MSVVAPELVHLSSDTLEGDFVLKETREDGTVVLAILEPTAAQMADDLGLAPAPEGRFDELFGQLPNGPS